LCATWKREASCSSVERWKISERSRASSSFATYDVEPSPTRYGKSVFTSPVNHGDAAITDRYGDANASWSAQCSEKRPIIR